MLPAALIERFGHIDRKLRSLLATAEHGRILRSGARIVICGAPNVGKSSLLKLLDGRTQPDDGDISRASGLRVATVEQEPELDENATVFDVVCNTGAEHEDWQRPSRVRATLEKLAGAAA